jgi:uncharacterized protein
MADTGARRPLALVTGASSGIGATYASRLAGRGYDLLLVARRKERLEKLARELEQSGGIRAEVLAADLAKDADLRQVEEQIARRSNLEFLVNNAGFGTLQMFHVADVESQDQMHRLHVLATLRLTHASLPGMAARQKGFLVNVSSVAGFGQGPGNVSYCATKAWMNSFSEGLYLEMRDAGVDVRVQALCPGYTISDFHPTLGLDRGFVSPSWWMRAEEVVDASLAGLERNKLFVIPGLRYKLIVMAMKLLPRPVLHAVSLISPMNRSRIAREQTGRA